MNLYAVYFVFLNQSIMTEPESAAPVQANEPKKGKAKPKTSKSSDKKQKSKPLHPPVASMVKAAIKALKERNGSSVQAIKKYIQSNYTVEIEKITPFIRKYLKSGVTKGDLVQAKGKGASGSFKLNKASTSEKPKKSSKPKSSKPKATKPKSATKSAKKSSSEKKPKKEKTSKKSEKSTSAASSGSATPKKQTPKKASKPKTEKKKSASKAKSPKKVSKKSPSTPKKSKK